MGRFKVCTTIARDAVFDPNVGSSSVYGKPKYVMITHGHADHFADAIGLKAAGAVVVAPRHCTPLVENPFINLMATMGWCSVPKELITPYFIGEGVRVDIQVEDGWIISANGLKIRALHTPGHTPGHTSYIIDTSSGRVIVAGDLVFDKSYISKYKLLYHTDTLAWISSLEKILKVDFDAIVPGHGAPAIGREAKVLVNENIEAVKSMLSFIESILPSRGEGLSFDEVIERVSSMLGFGNTLKAYSVLSPTIRAILFSLARIGRAKFSCINGVPRWRR